MDTLEQLQKQLEDTRSINLRLFEEIREKNEKEKVRVKKLEESHNVSMLRIWKSALFCPICRAVQVYPDLEISGYSE